MVVNDGFGVDTDRVIDRCQQLGRVNRTFRRGGAGGVGFAVHIATLDARTPHDGRVAVRPVIPTIGAVVVAGSGHAFFGAAAKFTQRNDERLIQQTARIQIVKQGGQTLVEHRSGLVLHAFAEADVVVPGVVV